MIRRITQLFVGLVLYGVGLALMVQAQIGIAPWDVLTQGMMRHTGLSFGILTIITSIVVLLLWIPLRQKAGIGTVANALLVGVFAEIALSLLPAPGDVLGKVATFGLGLLLVGVATGMYLGARFGPGPRDGLMTGLHRVTGWPVWIVRTGIEATVLIAGWLMGGDVGWGTLVFALLIGPLAGYFIPLLLVPAARPRR